MGEFNDHPSRRFDRITEINDPLYSSVELGLLRAELEQSKGPKKQTGFAKIAESIRRKKVNQEKKDNKIRKMPESEREPLHTTVHPGQSHEEYHKNKGAPAPTPTPRSKSGKKSKG